MQNINFRIIILKVKLTKSFGMYNDPYENKA